MKNKSITKEEFEYIKLKNMFFKSIGEDPKEHASFGVNKNIHRLIYFYPIIIKNSIIRKEDIAMHLLFNNVSEPEYGKDFNFTLIENLTDEKNLETFLYKKNLFGEGLLGVMDLVTFRHLKKYKRRTSLKFSKKDKILILSTHDINLIMWCTGNEVHWIFRKGTFVDSCKITVPENNVLEFGDLSILYKVFQYFTGSLTMATL